MDDVPVIDDVAMLSAGMRPPAAQRHQRRRAEEAFEPVVPRVRLRRPEDRLPAARGTRRIASSRCGSPTPRWARCSLTMRSRLREKPAILKLRNGCRSAGRQLARLPAAAVSKKAPTGPARDATNG